MPNEVEIKITADDLTGPGFASVLAKLLLLKKAAKDIGKSMSPEISAGNMSSSLIQLKQKMQSLGIADIADVNQTPGKITASLMLIKRLIQQAGISDLLDINVNDSKMESSLARIRAMIQEHPLAINPEFQPFRPPYKAFGPGSQNLYNEFLRNQMPPWQRVPMEIIDPSQISLANMFVRSLHDLRGAIAGVIGAAGGGGGGGSGMLGLAAAGDFFNKNFALRIAGWGTQFGHIRAWHVVLDALVEGAIIAVGSLAALGAAVYALGGSFKNLGTQLSAVYKVNSALGSKIPPLTDRFQALQKALAPQAIEIYGGALNAVNMEAGSMGKAMVPVTNLFTTFTAKFDLWLRGFGGTGRIFQAGIGFLDQLGHIFATLGMGIANLLRDDPGIARMLLMMVQGIADVFYWFTKLPAPIVAFVLELHGLYVWGSVIASLLGRLGKSFGGLYSMIANNITNPFAWAAVAAAGLIYLGYAANQATPEIKGYINAQNAALQQLSGMQAFQQSIVDVGDSFAKIKQQNWQTVVSGMSNMTQVGRRAGFMFDNLTAGIGNFLQLWSGGHIRKGLVEIGRGLFGSFTTAPFTQAAQNNIQALLAHVQFLNNAQKALVQTFMLVRKSGFDVAQSWALLSLAGVKMGDSVAVADQKVKNLIEGYKVLGIQGGMLANSVDAVTFQSLQQQSQVTALTGAWTNFFNLISGGDSAFIAFEQAMKSVHGNMTGLSSASLTSQQNFIAAAQAAQTEMTNLTMLSSAAGLGAKGTALLARANKDMLQQMLPAARQSQTLTTILYALAQQGGYRGADSFKALAAWIGKVQHPASNLNRVMGILTASAGNLTKDVHALSDALGQTLSNAMAAAIFAASGGQKAFDRFATAVFNAHGNINKMKSSAISFIPTLLKTTGSVQGAYNEFVVFAQAMGLTRRQANTLWQQSLPTLQSTINHMHGTHITITSNIPVQQRILDAFINTFNSINGAVASVTLFASTVFGGGGSSGGGGGGGQHPGGGRRTMGKMAVGGYASGRTVVGESGWELLDLPHGTYVHPHAESQRMVDSWGGGAGVVRVVLDVTGGDRELKNMVKKWVNIDGGGNVQDAFGDGN